MKTLELLDGLSPKELNLVESHLKDKGRESLLRLFRVLKPSAANGKPTTDKKKLYEQTFFQSYQPDKDFILRNELRLLNEAIFSIITRLEEEEDLKINPLRSQRLLLSGLLKRGMTKLFDQTIDKALRLAEQNHNYTEIYELKMLMLNRWIAGFPIDTAHYERILNLTLEIREVAKKKYSRNFLNAQVKTAFAIRTLRIMNPEFYPGLAVIEPFSKEEIERFGLWEKILHLEAKAYLQGGMEKIKTLETACLLLSKVDVGNSLPSNPLQINLLATIALEYDLEEQYEKAEEVYSRLLVFVKQNDLELSPEILFNLFNNKIKRGQYSEALALFEEKEILVKENPKVYPRFLCVVAMLYNLIGNPEKVFNIIPENLQQRPRPEIYYFRLALIIAWHLTNDTETALRECENMDRIIRNFKGNNYDLSYQDLIKVFRRFLLLSFIPSRPEKQLEVLDLKSSIFQLETGIPEKPFRNYLPLNWLKGKLEDY